VQRIRRARKTAVSVSLAAAFAAGVGACGSSSTGSAAQPTQKPGVFQLAAPAKLALLWEIKGESAYAIDDYNNGGQLAVSSINAAGGVGGHPLQTVRFPASPVDPQTLIGDFLKAVDAKPAAIVGIPGLTIQAVAPQFDRAAIPVIGNTTADTLKFGASLGSKWFYSANPAGTSDDTSAVKYTVESLHGKKVALLHTLEPYGTAGAAVIKPSLVKAGASVSTVVGYSPTASDLTAQVLRVKGSDVAIDWGYPNTIALQLKQFVDNSIDIPTVSTPGAAIAVTNKLVTGNALSKLYGVSACNLDEPTRPATVSFVHDYLAKYGYAPSTAAAIAYDSVYIAAEAIKQASSADPAAVRTALDTLKYTGGVCSPNYHSDGAHMLNHDDLVVSFPSGHQHTVASYTYPDEPKLAN
jgi:branched-chain amino acid transport system substrate-binding protein